MVPFSDNDLVTEIHRNFESVCHQPVQFLFLVSENVSTSANPCTFLVGQKLLAYPVSVQFVLLTNRTLLLQKQKAGDYISQPSLQLEVANKNKQKLLGGVSEKYLEGSHLS